MTLDEPRRCFLDFAHAMTLAYCGPHVYTERVRNIFTAQVDSRTTGEYCTHMVETGSTEPERRHEQSGDFHNHGNKAHGLC